MIELTVLVCALHDTRVCRLPDCANFPRRTWTLSRRVAHHVCDEFRGVPTYDDVDDGETVIQYVTVQCESVQVCVALFSINLP